MASEQTLYTNDGQWKVEVEAWKTNVLVYKSIGSEATVYHRQTHKNIWGNTVTDWVEKSASSISLHNVYSGSGPGTGTRDKTCTNASYCQLKEWAVGVTVTIPVDSPKDFGGGAILDIEKVDATVRVVIGNEVLTAQVSASSAFSDTGIW